MEVKLSAKDRQLSEQHGDFNNDKLDLERKVRNVRSPLDQIAPSCSFALSEFGS